MGRPDDTRFCIIAVVGTQLPGVGYSGCVFDTKARQWVSKVTLGLGNRAVNIDPLYEATMKYRGFIEPWIIQHFGDRLSILKEIPLLRYGIVEGQAQPNKSLQLTP